MIEPRISAVAPRFYSLCTEAVLPLADEIERLIDRGEKISVQIDGEDKLPALSHLAVVLAEHISQGNLRLEDKTLALNDVDPIVTVRTAHETQSDICLRLAPWGRDDFIEYLLSKHPQQCASVMARLSETDALFAMGAPSVWRVILDRMAGNPDKTNVEEVVVEEIYLRLNDAKIFNSVADRLILPASSDEIGEFGHVGAGVMDDMSVVLGRAHGSVRQFLSHEDVRIALAMRRFVDRLESADAREVQWLLSGVIGPGRLRRLAEQIRENDEILHKLNVAFLVKDRSAQATAAMSNSATLLSLCQASWRPSWRPSGPVASLFRGYFRDVSWPGVVLKQADLRQSCFINANLSGAHLGDARISVADFSFADLRMSDFQPARLPASEPDRPSVSADPDEHPRSLRSMREKTRRVAGEKRRQRRSMRRGKQESTVDAKSIEVSTRVRFANADLASANLSGCCFQATEFVGAMMQGVKAEHTQFYDVDFSRSDLGSAVFTESKFRNTDFSEAKLDRCDFAKADASEIVFDCLQATEVSFAEATLSRSSWTGSRLLRSNFRGALLQYSRFANIDWENCDLRGANLLGCTFHLGTTRSGIVGSPFPSHGTRTGFYTDEYEEQYFRSPETIRVANLRGADLRGAEIQGVDFYLVDLRGAKYDESQREQLVSTGAILDE